MKSFFLVVMLASTVGAAAPSYTDDLTSGIPVKLSSSDYDFNISSYDVFNFAPISTGPFTVEFFDKQKRVGTLYFDETGMWFEGKAKKSARVFFDYLKGNFDKYRKIAPPAAKCAPGEKRVDRNDCSNPANWYPSGSCPRPI